MNTEKLQKQMVKMAMNNSQLSKNVGVSEAYISMIVNGLRIPNVLVAKKIATVLECKIYEYLMLIIPSSEISLEFHKFLTHIKQYSPHCKFYNLSVKS